MTDEERRKLIVPVWCPICDGPMKGNRSTFCYYKYGCCQMCWVEFIDGREQRWLDGWRPSAEELKQFEEKYNKSPFRDSKLPEI